MNVSSYVGLTGTGGVQRSFSEYYAYARKVALDIAHTIYTSGCVEKRYLESAEVRDLSKPAGILRFILDLHSRKTIVHIYNRTTSRKLALLLSLVPVRKLVVHERGVVWNASKTDGPIIRFIAWKATLLLANSGASRQLLVQRFAVPGNKIRVIHNGVDASHAPARHDAARQSRVSFRVGFLGRLDTPKGVHVLIDAFDRIPESERIELVIAGDGPLGAGLREHYGGRRNVSFVGAVDESYAFLRTLDLLVVPSIREPLGNVCIEAGMCALPVLATRVDGIPEIIEDGISGELIDATIPVRTRTNTIGAAPLPEYVFDPQTRMLRPPCELDPDRLAHRIVKMKHSPELRRRYGEGLRRTVEKQFSLQRYASELHSIYRELDASR